MKKELNKGLLVLVVILSLLVVGLSSYFIYDKVFKEDNNVNKEEDKVDNNDKNDDEITNNDSVTDNKDNLEVVDVSKFYKKYSNDYSYSLSKMVEQPTEKCEDYAKLKLKSDGTYDFEINVCRGYGSHAKGNYIVDEYVDGYQNGKIYLINDLCKLDIDAFNSVHYGNCSPIFELTYIEENGEISINTNINGLGNIKLKQQ